jgi:hypothetical protein
LARPASGATGWLEEQAASSGTYQAVSIAPWVIVYTQRQGDQLAPPLYAPDGSALAQARARENATLGLTLRRAGASGAVLAQTQLTLSFGERSAAVLGGETLSIADADVEVANGAATIDPIMSDAFDGLIVSALPVRASDGATVVELRARAHVLAREPQVVAIGAPLSIQGERREYDDLIADERLVFAAQGGARRVTLGGGALVLEVELR